MQRTYGNNPKVSILLPNYNKKEYIYQRLESIKNQSYPDWELIIVDGYSDDGSWEVIKEFTKSINKPAQVLQLPRGGIYDAINECIKRTSGKYIYIATSDDLMTEDCISTMVNALEEHPECGICSSCLKMIDKDGSELRDKWLSVNSSKFYGSLLAKKHIRFAPHDAILQCFVYNVFTSLTQILIKKEVFDTIGLFNTNYGSAGDFEWELRATLRFNTIHLPNYLSSWRKYPEQATNSKLFTTLQGQINFINMIESVLHCSNTLLEKDNIGINLKELTYCNRFDKVINGFWEQIGYKNKIKYIINSMLTDTDVMLYLLYLKLFNKDFDRTSLAKKYIKNLSIDNYIKVL
jgi:glycosyltransferase involved in cell wall biosynthesis